MKSRYSVSRTSRELKFRPRPRVWPDLCRCLSVILPWTSRTPVSCFGGPRRLACVQTYPISFAPHGSSIHTKNKGNRRRLHTGYSGLKMTRRQLYLTNSYNQQFSFWKNKWNYFPRRREASNCMILIVRPPVYTIGEKKPEKNSGLQRGLGFESRWSPGLIV